MLAPSKFSRFALSFICLLVLFLLVIAARPTSARGELFTDVVQTAIALVACSCIVQVGLRSSGEVRRLWLLFAISISLLVVAQGLKTYYKHVAALPFASPWPSDVLFILWVIPALAMLLPTSTDEPAIDWETILDFTQVGIAALTAYLFLFYITSRWQAEGTRMVLNVIRLQMYRDLAITALFLFAARASFSIGVRELFKRVAGFFVLNAGWAAIFLLRWPKEPAASRWSEVAWTVPCIYATAFAITWETPVARTEQQANRGQKLAIVARLLPAGMPLLVLLMSLRIAHEQVGLAWTAMTMSFLISTARLVLTNEKQRRVADSLRQAEGALQQSSAMFTATFRSSPDAIGIGFLPHERYIAVNESFLKMTGYGEEEVIGKSAVELGLWMDLEQRSRIVEMLGAGKDIRDEEFLMRTKSGDVRTAQLSAAKVQLGNQAAIFGVIRDVTERRKAEEALRISEERFRTLVQDLHVGIVLLGPDAQTLFANRAVLNIFEVRGEHVIGKSTAEFEAVAVREDGTELAFPDRPGPRAISTKQAIRGEVVGWRRKGIEDIWTLVDAVPHMNEHGEVSNVILSISDITQRKKAEEALRESEERFRTLVESLHIGVVLLGRRAEVLFANAAALRMFGLSLEEALGKNSEELGLLAFSEDGKEVSFEARPGPRVLSTGEAVHSEISGWRRPGSDETLWLLGQAVPLFGREGTPEKLVLAFSDITKRKEAEQALHELSFRLLRLQDQERRRLARELHDSLAQSVMAVNLDLAQVSRSAPSLTKRAKQALSEAREVLRQMSREIRTLSYLLHPPVLDELGLASALKEYAQGFSERSGIAIELDIQSNFARLSEEAETALFRIVQESLANIQKHSGSLTGKISLLSHGDNVELRVSDEGRGIESAKDNGTAAKRPRLGVGILGMRERMTQLGGTLLVQSEGTGTTVRATIPLAREA